MLSSNQAKILTLSIFTALTFLNAIGASADTMIAKQHISQVLELRAQILKTWPKDKKPPQFVNVADFDGTLIFGDCTEGREGVFDGLARRTIFAGLSDFPANEQGYHQMLSTYEELQRTDEYGSVVYLPQVLDPREGPKRQALANFVRKTFSEELHQYIFPASRLYVEALREEGIETIVISASPHVFVEGAAAVLPLKAQNIYGIELDATGEPTDGILNFREGKLTRLRKIIADAAAKDDVLIPLLGLGNDWLSDYAFLQAIAEGEFGYSGIGVMINGLRASKRPRESKLIEVEHPSPI